ncbi:Uncharacterised protein [Nocardia brasiliensis]|nr:Uncharacterised protein [Nocardia brasiliensis]
MAGPDSAEVPAVQGCDFVRVEAFRDGEDRGINRAQREVGVFPNQFRHPGKVGPGEIDQFDLTARD